MVDLADGRRVVVQEYSDRATAGLRLHAAEQLAAPLQDHAVPVPKVLASDLKAATPWAVFEALDGEPGYVAAGHDLSGPAFPQIARDMGTLVRRMSELDHRQFDLPRLWADPAALAGAAGRWLGQLEAYLTSAETRRVTGVIDALPTLFGDRAVAVCHGDFGPQNVLVANGNVSGLVDLEDARIGDPLLDVAWWAWLVRAHTPEAFVTSWRGFVKSAGVPAQAHLGDRLLALIVVRLLETAEAYRRSTPEKHPGWAIRLSRTLGWQPRDVE